MEAIKEDFHKLIYSTTDKELLEDIFMILTGRSDYKEGQIWEGLSDEQKQETLKSESEINHDPVLES
jgi:hypothetical protein